MPSHELASLGRRPGSCFAALDADGGSPMAVLRMVGLLAAAAATSAFAHTGETAAHGLAAGFVHPFSGLDHVLAMTAVGLWAALVGGRALWAWPLAFVS